MKIHLLYLNISCILLCLAGELQAQIFPVYGSGMLVPPHSLTLSDYTFDRAPDLMYIVTLLDPVEESRPIKFRLTVLSDGTEIMVTNPNYNPPIIILEKDIPLMVDGADLAAYLNPNNLVSLNGQQAGGLLPEGFNAFCLEVIDLERNIPISDKICVSGFFELSYPPILNIPLCHTTLEWELAQNLTFNWFPQHLSTMNPPMDVQYEFELVQVLPDQNAYEAFLSPTLIYEETVYTPTLNYLEGASILELGKTYAWRVRAFDGFGHDLFSNGGYSEVCTFSFIEDEEPEIENNPNFTCNDGQCDWLGTPIEISHSGTFNIDDDKLKVGHFTMELTSISDIGDNLYDGEGTIYIPFLSTKLEVTFTNIKVNDNLRVYDGQIYSAQPNNTDLIPSIFDILEPGSLTGNPNIDYFPDATALALNTYFNSGNSGGMPNLVSSLDDDPEEDAIAITVPIGLDKEIPGTDVSLTIAITGIKFDKQTAQLNAVLATRLNENGEWVKFGIKDLPFQPGGFCQGDILDLVLLSDITLDYAGLPIKLLGQTPGEPGTFLSWNCDGFENFHLKGEYTFDENILTNLSNPGQSVKATFSASTSRLDDVMGELESMDNFSIVGVDDFDFSVGNAFIDLSEIRNPETIVFPPVYEDGSTSEIPNAWKGFFLKTMDLKLPEEISFSTSGLRTTFTGQNLLIDATGVSGKVLGTDILDVTSSLGGWGFSIESIGVSFSQNNFIEATIEGGVSLPLIDDPVGYTGGIQITENEGTESYEVNLHPAGDINLAIGPGELVQFSLYETSGITATYDGTSFEPQASLCGGITINVDQPTFTSFGIEAETLTEIETTIGAPLAFGASFDLCLDINPSSPDGKLFDLISFSGDFTLPGFPNIPLGPNALRLRELDIDISQTGIPDLPDFSNPLGLSGLTHRVLGLEFDLPIPIIRIQLGCWAISDQSLEVPDYDFAKFHINTTIPSFYCNCPPETQCSPLPISLTPGSDTDGTINILNTDWDFNGQNIEINNIDENGLVFQNEVIINLDFSLKEKLEEFFELPPEVENFDFRMDKVTLTPEGAKISAAVSFKLPNTETSLTFKTDDIGIFQGGLNLNDIKLYLEEDVNLTDMGLPGGVRLLGGNDNSYLVFNCSGIQEFQFAAKFDFPAEFIPISNSGESGEVPENVTATISLLAPRWGEFIGTATIPELFTIEGLEDFQFKITDAIIDLSKSTNSEEMVFPDGYTTDINNTPTPVDESWRGFFLKSTELTLPEAMSFSDDEANPRTTISGSNLLIDSEGVSGILGVKNPLTAGTGSMGGWGFSIDSIGVSFLKYEFVNAYIDGGITLPLMDDPMEYEGSLTYEAADENHQNPFYLASLSPKEDITLGLAVGPESEGEDLVAFTIYKDLDGNKSEITATYDNVAKKFQPQASLCGGINILIDKQVFTTIFTELEQPDLIDLITEIENFLPEGEVFEFGASINLCLDIDPLALAPDRRFTISGVDGSLDVPGFHFDLGSSALELRELDIPDLSLFEDPDFPDFSNLSGLPDLPGFSGTAELPEVKVMGMEFTIPIPGFPITMGCWAKSTLMNPSLPDAPVYSGYSFASFDFKIAMPEFSCEEPDYPSKFILSENLEVRSINVPLLSKDFVVILDNEGVYYKTDPGNQANIDFFGSLTLQGLLEKIPAELIPEGVSLGDLDKFDFGITGFTFVPDDENSSTIKSGSINLTLQLGEVGEGVTLGGSLPMHPGGFIFEGFKFGPQ